MGPKCLCVYKYNHFRRLNNPSQMRKDCEQVKNKQNVRFHAAKNLPMVPPLDHFQGKNKNRSSLARMISMSRRSFFVNLTTFKRRSGLKKLSLLKIVILKMG